MPVPRHPPIPAAIPIPSLTQTHIVPGRLKITELFFNVPLDWSNPLSQKIRIFCRAAERAETPIIGPQKPSNDTKPWLVYIPGGPGFGASPPQDMGLTSIILDRGYRLLYFDHRGTGLSTPVTADSVLAQGDVAAQVRYLSHFRADNAVRDLEAIRLELTFHQQSGERKRWSLWGQSYGGFLTLTYLSMYPQNVREVFSTGGLAPITQTVPDEIYRRLWAKVAERNRAYYDKYPEDKARVRKIIGHLQGIKTEDDDDDGDDEESEDKQEDDNIKVDVENPLENAAHPYNYDYPVQLPSGGLLTPARFRSLGIAFGSHGGLDDVHQLVLRAANDLEMFGYISKPTLSRIEANFSFETHIIYAILHEPIYCQAGNSSRWSAHRTLLEKQNKVFRDTTDTIYFFGEMVLPSDFTAACPELQRLAPAARAMASSTAWPALYDVEQLRQNDVPVYAAVYVDDMYVDYGFAMETAAIVKNCKTFVTNAMYHDAVRARVDEVARALFALRDDCLD